MARWESSRKHFREKSSWMKNLLVVDDDELVCMLIGKLSERNGTVATAAKTGEDARRLLTGGQKFDVVFLDLIIPCISGWDILAMIRADPAIKDTPVVIMTGFFLSEDESDKLRGNVMAVIDKNNFKAEDVERLLRSVPGRLQ